MKRFEARLDILPAAQKLLWPELSRIPKAFVLYGGTAIALRLGHRQSVDFDFFTSGPVELERLMRLVPFLSEAEILQSAPQTLTVSIQRGGPVKLSFFGGLGIGRVGEPDETSDGVLLVASLLDLAGLKAAVVQQRAESRDYVDLLAMMDQGISLARALGAAQALYPERFNPMVTLKALSYFADGDLYRLSRQQQERLSHAASERFEIPQTNRVSVTLSPVSEPI